jgi:hypothetical protein
MVIPKFSWNEYFTSSPTTTRNGSEYGSRQSYSSGSFYVLNCLFKNIISSSSGGAVYCNSVTYLVIESSSFFTCKTSSQCGGAIYFTNSNYDECVLDKVCGYDCCSTHTSPHYQFAYIDVYNGVSRKNYVNYSSITRCVSESSNSNHILYLLDGKICCQSINMSMNKCQYYSGIYCFPYPDSNSFMCSLSYSSFTDNNAAGYYSICFGYGSTKYEMKSCNVLRNTQGSGSYGIIYANGITNIEDSCIIENTATYIFYSTSSSYPITLINSTVDKTTNNGYLTTKNTVTKSFILGLNHISTRNCYSEYDSAGYLTVISAKKKICYTFNYCHSRISDLITLPWIQLLFYSQFQ